MTFRLRMAGASIMMVTYGHQVSSTEDKFVALAEAVRENSESRPGNNIVDLIPICKPRNYVHIVRIDDQRASEVCPSVVPGCRV